jgi:hypothetical protein
MYTVQEKGITSSVKSRDILEKAALAVLMERKTVAKCNI